MVGEGSAVVVVVAVGGVGEGSLTQPAGWTLEEEDSIVVVERAARSVAVAAAEGLRRGMFSNGRCCRVGGDEKYREVSMRRRREELELE